MTQKEKKKMNKKDKFRQSKAWKDWRKTCYNYYKGKDYVTGKPLYKGYNLHHLDNKLENYSNLDDEERFLPLNSKTHAFIEWLWTYWKKDHGIIDRIIFVLEKMKDFGSK